jgi:hypothetical protein
MEAIIPAAGSALRMRGLPKFLLPCDTKYQTLLEKHIDELLNLCETIWIPTRPEYKFLLESLGVLNKRVVCIPMVTRSMNETVLEVLKISTEKYFHLAMPDTYFKGESPYSKLSLEPPLADVACWKIRPEQKGKLGQVNVIDNRIFDIIDKDPSCEFEYSWGSLTFDRNLLGYTTIKDPHIGFALKNALENGEFLSAKIIDGKYFDCGTPIEYITMVKEVMTF